MATATDFKVGDIVCLLKNGQMVIPGMTICEFVADGKISKDLIKHGSTAIADTECEVRGIENGYVIVRFKTDGRDLYTQLGFSPENVRPIKRSNNSTPMNLIDSFTTALAKEPEKTFIKAGIITREGFLTIDGEKIFLSWLLREHFAVEFKKNVVDGIVAEQKEAK